MLRSEIHSGCRVGFFGMGRSNLALLSTLPLENCLVTLRSDVKLDRDSLPQGVRIDRICDGDKACREIDEDILFFSPSVRRERPELQDAGRRGVAFSSDAELFFEENGRPVFAVTGSDGKSTTATLIHMMLTEAGEKSRLIGNIGEPMISGLESAADCFVTEMSSFMLRYFQPKAERACITNITPNHLDWHRDYEEYKKTKLSLIKNAEKFVISEESSDVPRAYGIVSDLTDFRELRHKYEAEIYLTSEKGYICKNGERLISLSDVTRSERHNIKNLMMAIAMTDGYVGTDETRAVARAFGGLPHRCEVVLRRCGVDFVDSSIDSTPARTAQTLKSLDREVIIILGGRGKGLDFRELVPSLKRYARRALIVGENGEDIYRAIGKDVPCEMLDDFNEAVRRGAFLAKDVGALLLSPASTSYDKFKNYAERGDKFKEILLKMQ